MNYDIVGDIHGQAGKLEALLTELRYEVRGSAWQHPERTAIFVGDFIDRGDKGVETVRIVRSMVESGSALAVMGNHELNAIAWHTPDHRTPGEYLRPRETMPWGPKNRTQHEAFLKQVAGKPALHQSIVDWFLTLPLWLDLPELRVVHACWHQPFIDWLLPRLRDGRYLTLDLMVEATNEPADKTEKDNAEPSIFKAVEALTKGIELQLPEPHFFLDKDGIRRTRVRARWWNTEATTFRQISHMPDEERQQLPSIELPAHARLPQSSDKPVFFGHYWMEGNPSVQTPHAACVDYSAGKGGPLVAYRQDGAAPLSDRQFVGRVG